MEFEEIIAKLPYQHPFLFVDEILEVDENGKSGNPLNNIKIALTSSEVDFFKPIFPSEKVIVKSKKEYFRFNKLKCKVEMYNEEGVLVCRGKIAGMMQY
jgi:3-hydroxyacyl-[acyl-carrier-protein] dehydratase